MRASFVKDTAKNIIDTKRHIKIFDEEYDYYSIKAIEEATETSFSRLPFSLKVILENLLRFQDGESVKLDHILSLSSWLSDGKSNQEIMYRPARVLMQDFTGVPAVVDLAAMREAMKSLGGDPQKINPLSPVELVIDHSVTADKYGSKDSMEKNIRFE